MIRRKLLPLLFALIVGYNIGSITGVSIASAQDATPEVTPTQEVVVIPPDPTAEATAQPPVVVIPPVTDTGPSDRTLLAIGAIVTGILGGLFIFLQHRRAGDLIEALNKALDNKAVQDEAHQRYTQASITVQQAIQFAEAFFKLAGGLDIPTIDPLLDKVAEFTGKVTSPNGVGELVG